MNAPINRNADRGGAMSTRTTAAPRAPTARLRVPLRPRPRPHRRRGIVGPTLLIASGSLLLLNTTGLVGWDVWAVLWRLWPVIPIAVGLDILLGRRSLAGSAIVAAALLVVLVGGAWAAAAGMPAAGRETIARPRDGLTGAEVTIVPGVADLRLAAAGDVTLLIAGTVDRARGETIAQDYRADGGVGRYTIASQETRGLPFAGRATGGGDRTWDLAVARDLPTALRVDTGVGRTTLDLTGLQLTELDVDTGVGQTVITLPAQGRFSGTVDIGVGELIVRVPAGTAARIRIEAGLGNAQVPAGYARQGDWYVSPGYATAANRIELEIDGGVGHIIVEEIGGP